MAFMTPNYDNNIFVTIENLQGELTFCPQGYEDLQDGDKISGTFKGKFFARLSADGYMDCTDWSGPFPTLEEAQDFIEETYNVDKDTGEELPEF